MANITNLKNGIVDYLQNQQGLQNLEEPALLFAQSNKNSKFPDIFLFGNFGYCNANSLSARSDITTNYVENNVAVQDHWALPPIEYTLNGSVGEVLYIPPTTWANWAEENAINFLAPLSTLSPVASSYTQSAINLVTQIEDTVKRYGQIARKIYSAFDTNSVANTVSNQQYIYEQLMSLRQNRQLVDVYTPYGKLLDMAMASVNLKQDESLYISKIEVRLQQWQRVAQLESRNATEAEKNMIVDLQKSPETSNAYSGEEELMSHKYKEKYGIK